MSLGGKVKQLIRFHQLCNLTIPEDYYDPILPASAAPWILPLFSPSPTVLRAIG